MVPREKWEFRRGILVIPGSFDLGSEGAVLHPVKMTVTARDRTVIAALGHAARHLRRSSLQARHGADCRRGS